MYVIAKYTALSPAAINGLKESGMNAMLLSKNCVEINEQYNFIRGRAIASVFEKLESLDVDKMLKNMEKRLTDIVDSKVGEAMTTTCGKVEKTYAAVVAVDKTTSGKPKGTQNAEAQKAKSQYQPKFQNPRVKRRPIEI